MHARANARRKAAHMGIHGLQTVAMRNGDDIAVSALAACLVNFARTSGVNRRSLRCAEVDACMHFGIAQQRMLAHAKARGQSCSRNRRAQQSPRSRAAVFIEIFSLAIFRAEAVKTATLAINRQPRHMKHFALSRRA